ncbi:hypothetical protein GCM10018772_05560 [Streptomyces fumanus]|uniref:Uncharacterized protein n=1 Tax=Streptomyces fumanus TaxID=67302 RepID=A0A919A412_9ACTN|nr:hypothetical protein GCM10018772_05560 [Streptomyces fumanus]
MDPNSHGSYQGYGSQQPAPTVQVQHDDGLISDPELVAQYEQLRRAHEQITQLKQQNMAAGYDRLPMDDATYSLFSQVQVTRDQYLDNRASYQEQLSRNEQWTEWRLRGGDAATYAQYATALNDASRSHLESYEAYLTAESRLQRHLSITGPQISPAPSLPSFSEGFGNIPQSYGAAAQQYQPTGSASSSRTHGSSRSAGHVSSGTDQSRKRQRRS